MNRRQDWKLLVGGEWIRTGNSEPVLSPFDDSVVGYIPVGDGPLARKAIDAAAEAMSTPIPAWRRGQILEDIAREIEARSGELAQLVCAEAGKPIQQATAEVGRCVTTHRAAAVEALKLTGETIPADAAPNGEHKLVFTKRVPVGVVGAITPFNFPLNLTAHKTAPAFAAGCATVVKPAPQAPLSALALAEIYGDCGVPDGWINVVYGDPEAIGDELLTDERVGLITFTGSARVGWMLREKAPRKRVALELGNSTPVIVTAGCDLSLAAEKITESAFAFAGQACISAQRVIVERSIRDEFLAEFLPRVERLTTGDPGIPATNVGPIIDDSATNRLRAWLDEAVAQGAEVLAGGVFEGRVLAPTVMGSASSGMRICQEEVFGPVVSVLECDDVDHAFDIANDSPYGLQAAVFTRDLGVTMRATEQLDFGGVVINDSPTFRLDHAPYGGEKESGNTKEGPASAVREMTVERLVAIDTR